MSRPNRPNSELEPILEAIDLLDDERAELLIQKNEMLKQAEEKGYPKKIVRKILQRRAKERAEVLEEDQQLNQFEEELGYDVLG